MTDKARCIAQMREASIGMDNAVLTLRTLANIYTQHGHTEQANTVLTKCIAMTSYLDRMATVLEQWELDRAAFGDVLQVMADEPTP